MSYVALLTNLKQNTIKKKQANTNSKVISFHTLLLLGTSSKTLIYIKPFITSFKGNLQKMAQNEWPSLISP